MTTPSMGIIGEYTGQFDESFGDHFLGHQIKIVYNNAGFRRNSDLDILRYSDASMVLIDLNNLVSRLS